MRDDKGIIERLDTLISQGDKAGGERKKSRKLAWGMFYLTVLGLIISFFLLGIQMGWFKGGKNNEDPSPQTQIQSFSELIEKMHPDNEPMTNKRFELLEANVGVVPNDLSLNGELKRIIELFLPESYKLKVIRLLRPKITTDYSDDELEEFKNLFNEYKKKEVEDLLPERQK